jgi:hypothetical protein
MTYSAFMCKVLASRDDPVRVAANPAKLAVAAAHALAPVQFLEVGMGDSAARQFQRHGADVVAVDDVRSSCSLSSPKRNVFLFTAADLVR